MSDVPNGMPLGITGCGVVHEVGNVREVGRGKRVKVKMAGFPMDAFSDRKIGLMELELRITDVAQVPTAGQAIWIAGGTYDIGLGSEGTKYHNVYAFTWWIMYPEKLGQLFGTPAAVAPREDSVDSLDHDLEEPPATTNEATPVVPGLDLAALAAAQAAAEGAIPANEPQPAVPTGTVPDDSNDDPDLPW